MLKKLFRFAIICALLVAAVIAVCYLLVNHKTSGRHYGSVDEIPHNQVGLLLGTSPFTALGARNLYFEKRIKAADELFHAGKVDYIIASGGDYSDRGGYNEPVAMRDSLVAHGVPADRVILDYEGTRTLNSIAKAREVYRLDSVTIISQKYHNQRAIYLADRAGLHAIGYDAKPSPIRRNRIKNTLREYLARVKMFIDIAVGKKANVAADSLPIPELKPVEEKTFDTARVAKSRSNRPVDIVDTLDLRIYYPNYSRIDLVCGNRPQKTNDSIIFMAEAAFTGECLKEFKHSNIHGDHVTAGKREKGTHSRRLNGAFTWYPGYFGFHQNDLSGALDIAAQNGGCGFCQEMMIHEGVEIPHTRKADNANEFRALCLIDGRLAVADSSGKVTFGHFISDLLKAGATEALYLDMGTGWNFSWYRDASGKAVNIHSIPGRYCTNWITFYK